MKNTKFIMILKSFYMCLDKNLKKVHVFSQKKLNILHHVSWKNPSEQIQQIIWNFNVLFDF